MKLITLIALFASLTSISFAKTKSGFSSEKEYSPVASYTFDSSYTHEITTNISRGFFDSSKACSNCSSVTTLDLSAAYLHSWKNNMQYGVEAELKNISSIGTGLELIGIGTYNLSHDFKNALYFKGGAGLYSLLNNHGNGFENKFGFFLGIGKRFNWISNIAYAPELRIVKRGDLDFAIHADLINFSIFWN